MPYEKQSKDVDAGPIGHLRLAKRAQQEARAAVAVPSATGGAPTTPAGRIAAAMGEESPNIEREQERLRERFNLGQVMQPNASAPPVTYAPNMPMEIPDVLTSIPGRMTQEFEKWVKADPLLVRQTVEYVEQNMGDVLERTGMTAEEVGERVFVYMRGIMEPRPEALPLGDIMRPTLFSRRIMTQLKRWRNASSTYALPPIERGE